MGKKLEFQYERAHRFAWGGVTLQIQVRDGVIGDLLVCSDAMKPELIQWMNKGLQGVRYQKQAMCEALAFYSVRDEEERHMIEDLTEWIYKGEE